MADIRAMQSNLEFIHKVSYVFVKFIHGLEPEEVKMFAIKCFAVIGVSYFTWKFLSFWRMFLSLFLWPGKSFRDFGPNGSWAVVTGASDGIGREFALQLGEIGFSVLLISRTTSKLEAVAAEITRRYPGTSTKVLSMDFVANDDSAYEKLQKEVDELDVAILINCAGRSHDIPVPFALTTKQEMEAIIATNCTGTLRMTSTVLPGMIQRKRGLVLTMGSFGGLLPTPLLATYSGSKAFLQQWSSALGAELRPHKITVELVQSYLVTSNMSKIKHTSWLIPSPRTYVESVLERIGRSGGASGWAYTSTPYWSHALVAWLLENFVGTTNKFVVGQNKDMHEGIRSRALRKAERDSGKKAH
ncbi:MAG: hypothetical protein MMC33_005239 [Icmadophila ericetorum]|nr:hypothetical protein [Icmadophila ericetorum]